MFGGLFGNPFWDDEPEELTFEEKLNAAEDGDEEAMLSLAQDYLRGSNEVDPDPGKAAYWMEKAAEKDNPLAQYNIGLFYAKGHGVQRDFDKAIEWEERAANHGDEDAIRVIKKWKRINGLTQNAEAGDAQAQADLANIYMELGRSLSEAGPGDNYDISLKWAYAAASQENLDGMYILALAFNHGRGVEQNMSKAIELYRKASEMGHAPSKWNLAACYMRGDGVEYDPKQYKEWAEKSSMQGYVLAVRGLVQAYEMGKLDEPYDEKKVLEFYEKVCEANPDSGELQHELGLKYMEEDEEGHMISLDRALYWFKKAADNGDKMCISEYSFWRYVKKLINDGVFPAGTPEGDYVKYIFENGLLGEAEYYTP